MLQSSLIRYDKYLIILEVRKAMKQTELCTKRKKSNFALISTSIYMQLSPQNIIYIKHLIFFIHGLCTAAIHDTIKHIICKQKVKVFVISHNYLITSKKTLKMNIQYLVASLCIPVAPEDKASVVPWDSSSLGLGT